MKIVEELESVCLEILGRQLDRMFDGADDMLFEMAKRATSNDDQRVFFDTMRAVRLGRPSITQNFADGIVQHFAPDSTVEHTDQPSLIDFDELTLQESHAVEETIAVSNMATKAEGLYKNQIWELERRFNWLIRERRAALSVQALAPASICATFRDSIVRLDVEFAVRIIIYKLFDRLVISDLLELYTAALRFLDANGVKPQNFVTPPRPLAAPPSHAPGEPSTAGPLGDTVEQAPFGGGAGMNAMASPGIPMGAPGGRAMPGGPEFGPVPLGGVPSAGGEGGGHGFGGPMVEGAPMGPGGSAGGGAGGSTGVVHSGGGGAGGGLAVGGAGGFAPVGGVGGGGFAPGGAGGGGNGGGVGMAPGSGMVSSGGGGGGSKGAGVSALDAQTLGSLQSVVGGGGGAPQHYTDSMLATDLETAARGNTVQGWSVPQAFSYVQRTGMVGKMFNEILADPNLPQTLKPQFDQLRFSVIKNALKDANFFANPSHPVRGIVNELATMAATARATGQESLQRIEDLVSQIRGQFEIAADTVKTPDPETKSFEDSEVERFIEQQQAQTKSRRQAIISKTRRIVAEELQLRTAGMVIPNSVRPLLNSGWAPMMALHLLRHGPKSEPWNQGLELLDQILGSLQMLPDGAERASLDQSLRSSFALVAMPEARIETLVAGLTEAWSAAEVRIAERAAEAAAEEAARIEREQQEAAQALLQSSRRVTLEGEIASSADPGAVEVDDPPMPGPEEAPAAVRTEAAESGAEEPVLMQTAEFKLAAADDRSEAHAAAYDPVSLLDLLVVPGNWFLVYDRQIKSNRWLKAVLRYRDKDLDRGSIAFAEFNGKNTLLVKAQDFLEDLIARRTEPIDLSPAAKHAFDEFLAVQETGGRKLS